MHNIYILTVTVSKSTPTRFDATIFLCLFVPIKFLKVDVCTWNFVESYCICPTKAQYVLTMSVFKALLHVSMFIRHSQGVSYDVRSSYKINKIKTLIQVILV